MNADVLKKGQFLHMIFAEASEFTKKERLSTKQALNVAFTMSLLMLHIVSNNKQHK